MPIVTDLRPSKKSQNLVLLYIDNRFYLRLPIDLVLKHQLKIGSELTKKTDKLLKIQTTRQYYFDRAVNFLSYRPRSKAEIRFFLISKFKAGPKMVAKILTRLEELGLQNDSDFADWLIRSRISQGKSLMFLKRELSQKGIDPELIGAKLQDIDPILPAPRKILSYFQKYYKKDPKTALIKTRFHFAQKGFVGNALKMITEIIKNSEVSD
jgi:regulatory protein